MNDNHMCLFPFLPTTNRAPSKNLQRGIRGHEQDTALATFLILALLHSDVSILTPRGTPGVLHLPVVHTIVSAVANSQDTVVQVGAAVTSVHTRGVQLEAELISLDGHRHGLLVHSGLERGLRVGSHIGVRGDLGASHRGARGRVASASVTVAGGVGVVFFRADTTVSLDPVEGSVHLATVAAHVGEASASDQLLLGEGHEVAVLVVVGKLHGTGGGEDPARAARALVLHASHTALRHPIPRGGGALEVFLSGSVGGHASLQHRLGHGGEVSLHELSVRHARELVVGHLPGSAGSVVLVDELVPANEDLESLQKLGAVLELSVVLDHPIEELLFVVFSVVGHGRDGEENQKSDNLVEHDVF